MVAEAQTLQQLTVEGLEKKGSQSLYGQDMANQCVEEHTCTVSVFIFPRQVSKNRFKSFTEHQVEGSS